MQRVSQATALRHWLAREREKRDVDAAPVAQCDERAVLDELLRYKPGAAAFVWRDAPVEWYRTTLDRAAFDRLRVVEGPDDLGWRALAADGTVRGCARALAGTDPDRFESPTGVDAAHVRDLRERLDPPLPPLVLSTRRGRVPRHVADGNHRAVALALELLDGASYVSQPVFLGVGANPVVRPLVERVRGRLRTVLDR